MPYGIPGSRSLLCYVSLTSYILHSSAALTCQLATFVFLLALFNRCRVTFYSQGRSTGVPFSHASTFVTIPRAIWLLSCAVPWIRMNNSGDSDNDEQQSPAKRPRIEASAGPSRKKSDSASYKTKFHKSWQKSWPFVPPVKGDVHTFTVLFARRR